MKPVLQVQKSKSALERKHLVLAQREKLLEVLQQKFGYTQFRGRQIEAIETVLSGTVSISHFHVQICFHTVLKNPCDFCRKRLFLFDANWWGKIAMLSNTCTSKDRHCTNCVSFNRYHNALFCIYKNLFEFDLMHSIFFVCFKFAFAFCDDACGRTALMVWDFIYFPFRI